MLRDQDGLTDNQERSGWIVSACPTCPRAVASNPNLPDTDVDGLPDYAEAHMPCAANAAIECPTDPTNPDTDGDGLSDFDELGDEQIARLDRLNSFFPGYTFVGGDSESYGTDARLIDTDSDQLADNFELFTG